MHFRDLPLDSNGKPFSMPTLWLHSKEYSKITSEINQLYAIQYVNEPISMHSSYSMDGKAYYYRFENHGFNDYNIFMKIEISH